GFLDGSGIDTDEGVLVNDMLETSISGVFAAGDCAQGPDFSTGGNAVHAIQPTATEHGHIAALNMTGNRASYQGSLNMNVLDTVGLISTSFGQWQGVEGSENVELIDAGSFRYTYLAFDDDCLVGAVTLGRTNNIGVMRGLIQSRIKLGEWKDKLLADPNRLVEAYIACRQ
ncbi:MAG: NAD(P)/FAD-dependent oxidoreductase, partial [Rhodobacteraceae bacterium]|nr:NAD(P)/FAD-dependent oxidoreductase [Paracoccaceae bacterium]